MVPWCSCPELKGAIMRLSQCATRRHALVNLQQICRWAVRQKRLECVGSLNGHGSVPILVPDLLQGSGFPSLESWRSVPRLMQGCFESVLFGCEWPSRSPGREVSFEGLRLGWR